MPPLPFQLERTVVISANSETVFRFFTDSVRWAIWWGAGSTIDAQPGGKLYIRHPNGVENFGEVLEVSVPERIVFTYGDRSRVTIRVHPDDAGTRLHLLHEFADAAPRDEHIQGWRFQLSLLSNAVANEAYANAAQSVDAWFEAWTIADVANRKATLVRLVDAQISFRDRFSTLDGLEDLSAHIGAALRFMPGIGLQRKGDVRQCQGMVLANWIAVGSDGKERMSGTSVFNFEPNGQIRSVTGFANAA